MYNKKLVAVVKVNGKVLREQDDTVYIPFGSEYSIMLKNLHTTKVQVDISIDGDNVLDNKLILINPGESTEIEGFLKGNCVSNKFKFIEKTDQISDFRGNRIDDGIINIKYQFEYARRYSYDDILCKGSMSMYNSDITPKYASCNSDQLGSIQCNSSIQNDEGITVHGSASNQSFQNGYIGSVESEKHSICIHLKGCNKNNEYISKPITVKTKVQCMTCGNLHKFGTKYCCNCGTCLV